MNSFSKPINSSDDQIRKDYNDPLSQRNKSQRTTLQTEIDIGQQSDENMQESIELKDSDDSSLHTSVSGSSNFDTMNDSSRVNS